MKLAIQPLACLAPEALRQGFEGTWLKACSRRSPRRLSRVSASADEADAEGFQKRSAQLHLKPPRRFHHSSQALTRVTTYWRQAATLKPSARAHRVAASSPLQVIALRLYQLRLRLCQCIRRQLKADSVLRFRHSANPPSTTLLEDPAEFAAVPATSSSAVSRVRRLRKEFPRLAERTALAFANEAPRAELPRAPATPPSPAYTRLAPQGSMAAAAAAGRLGFAEHARAPGSRAFMACSTA